jgi:hypothetical protein
LNRIHGDRSKWGRSTVPGASIRPDIVTLTWGGRQGLSCHPGYAAFWVIVS